MVFDPGLESFTLSRVGVFLRGLLVFILLFRRIKIQFGFNWVIASGSGYNFPNIGLEFGSLSRFPARILFCFNRITFIKVKFEVHFFSRSLSLS